VRHEAPGSPATRSASETTAPSSGCSRRRLHDRDGGERRVRSRLADERNETSSSPSGPGILTV
jgi:hypothetical protein